VDTITALVVLEGDRGRAAVAMVPPVSMKVQTEPLSQSPATAPANQPQMSPATHPIIPSTEPATAPAGMGG
jgi:hypothetical protein